ncbi:hypothetical protein CL614_01680 [archaeon]|nr:hypothetical protein [archaeon]|tara:strand:- start:2849 stop:3298 length:450 start_codon:yes stop_codon:yes gene_type:complete
MGLFGKPKEPAKPPEPAVVVIEDNTLERYERIKHLLNRDCCAYHRDENGKPVYSGCDDCYFCEQTGELPKDILIAVNKAADMLREGDSVEHAGRAFRPAAREMLSLIRSPEYDGDREYLSAMFNDMIVLSGRWDQMRLILTEEVEQESE